MKIIYLLVLLLFSVFANNLKAKPESLQLLSNIDLFDVGLAKINNDKYYDIYTINQQQAESYFMAQGGKFVESGLSLGLKQTLDYPDYEATGRSPKRKQGLNIFTTNRSQLLLSCKACENTITGTIRFATPKGEKNSIKVLHQHEATSQQDYKIKVGRPSIEMEFTLEKDGLIVLDVLFMDTNMEFSVDYPAAGIFLGENSISPSNNQFSLSSRDNHSFAWAKLTDDDNTDVFMSSGGLRSRIKDFHPLDVISGLLYVQESKPQKFTDKYKDARLFKQNCITYRAEWIDVDTDGDLDLFVGCRNGINQMYRQYGVGSGKFEDIAIDHNFAFYHGEEFEWLDWNNDHISDLLLIQNNKLHIYKNTISVVNTARILRHQVFDDLGENLNSVNSSIRAFDIDNNGVPEIFVSTQHTIHYFAQDSTGQYQKIDISTLGLPNDISGTLNFVDVNLDGLVDICAVNHGIFLQTKAHIFAHSPLYPELFSQQNQRYKNLIWFDADINGQWDVLDAQSYPPKQKQTTNISLGTWVYQDLPKWDHLTLHRNISSTNKNNWLQIDLHGTPFNRDGIGARITVATKDGIQQSRYNHGSSDSLHSQGHYRHYFGLNIQPTAEVKVYWPDGEISTLKDVKANQLLTVKHTVETQ